MEAGQATLPSSPESPIWAKLLRALLWAGGIALAIFILNLLGIPIGDWIHDLFKKIREVPLWAVVGGIILETIQTTLAAVAWFSILRAAFPRADVTYRLVLASYAAAVALNTFLPANIGTWVMLVMFATVIAGATFTAVFSGIAVQKIPFSVFNIILYLYLFLTIKGSFSIKLGFISDHPVTVIAIIAGIVVGIIALTRIFRRQWAKFRTQLLVGGAILRTPKKFLTGVALPEFGSYLAKLGIIAVFLGAYGIPVTFHNVANVTASNSISNTVSFTPGGVGVTQAMNTAALSKSTSASTATAYSASQQLITSAWSVLFGTLMVCWVFGWRGGRDLVRASYDEAKERSREMKEQRQEKKRAAGGGLIHREIAKHRAGSDPKK